MKPLALLLCAWVVTGCAIRMVNPAKSPREVASDGWDCQRDASAAAAHPAHVRSLYRSCMQARGYTEQ